MYLRIFSFAAGFESIGYCLSFFGHKIGNLRAEVRSLGLDNLTHIILPTANPNVPWYAATIVND